MFRWNKVLYLLLKTAPYRAFALNLCPLSTNEPVSGASKGPNLPGESILAMETPGCGVAGIVPAQSLMKSAVNRITYRNHSPDRLVTISFNDDGNSFMWMLVHCADIGIVQYLTLSHCLGSSKHTSRTRENHSALVEPTPDSRLSKSFWHALSITFSLGFHYIWIDPWCIT